MREEGEKGEKGEKGERGERGKSKILGYQETYSPVRA